jgi:CxxC motif-containing protein (DUF1111 family)
MTGMRKRSLRLRLRDGVLIFLLVAAPVVYAVTPTEAPAGYDNQTNGFEAQAAMDVDRGVFDEIEQISDGLGPIYNAQSCRECHQSPVSGTISQVTELRVGFFNGETFTPPVGGSSLNHDRAIDPAIQERVMGTNNVATFRTSLNLAGDGFVEAIPDQAFTSIQASQPNGMKGTIIQVPVLEASGALRIARFGWKNQHASLVSFASDAYLNEMGITNPLNPNEVLSNGRSTAPFDTVPDPEDQADANNPDGHDIDAFARFLRSLKVPPRDTVLAATPDAVAGAQLFAQIGCSTCHVTSITTAPTGTVINGGTLTVPDALGGKVIHPYSDFMLHDVGTGDFIVQNGPQSTATQMRTAPLWGMRTRDRLMHDGLSLTRNDAILRHSNQAGPVISRYQRLTTQQKNQLITFLNSL